MRADADERFAQDVIQRAQRKDPSRKLGEELDALTVGIVKLAKAFENEDLRQLSRSGSKASTTTGSSSSANSTTGGPRSTTRRARTPKTRRNSSNGAPPGKGDA